MIEASGAYTDNAPGLRYAQAKFQIFRCSREVVLSLNRLFRHANVRAEIPVSVLQLTPGICLFSCNSQCQHLQR